MTLNKEMIASLDPIVLGHFIHTLIRRLDYLNLAKQAYETEINQIQTALTDIQTIIDESPNSVETGY